VQDLLRVGDENRPAAMPIWRADRGNLTYYAAWVCPSAASDAATRKDFVEKRVLEWRIAAGLPAAAVALVLLKEARNLGAAPYTVRDSRSWDDPNHFEKLTAVTLAINGRMVHDALTEALSYWRDQPSHLLARFFAGIRLDRLPSILAQWREPVPPEALAALLLPFPAPKANSISLAGWLPSARLDDAGGTPWHGVVSPGPAEAPDAASVEDEARAAALAQGIPELARCPIEPVRMLLDFAASRSRTLAPGKLTQDKSTPHPCEFERRKLEEALLRLRAEAEAPSNLEPELADARKRHLRRKADVFEAGLKKLFGISCSDARVEPVRAIIALWEKHPAG
jgi:hypothetical protein